VMITLLTSIPTEHFSNVDKPLPFEPTQLKESFDEVIISSLNFTIALSQVDIFVALV